MTSNTDTVLFQNKMASSISEHGEMENNRVPVSILDLTGKTNMESGKKAKEKSGLQRKSMKESSKNEHSLLNFPQIEFIEIKIKIKIL